LTRRVFKGRSLVVGSASGEALASRRAFTFAHGVEPGTGVVTDVHSDMKGSNVAGKVLFYPYGKGSTTGSSWFLETVRLGNGPAAIVTEGPDLTAVIGSVMAKIIYGKAIPVLSDFPRELYASVKSGAKVEVDGERAEVVLK
jgi:predicted aconitase with swiveling domain